jgi:multidrug efflux pump subunit AcrA (membrane-fusion protein)
MTAHGLAAAAGAPALVVLAACSTPQVYDRPLTPVTVGQVESYATGTTVRYSATARPAVEVTAAFKVGGYVDDILTVVNERGHPRIVQEGDRVSRMSSVYRRRAPASPRPRPCRSRRGSTSSAPRGCTNVAA